MHRNEQTNWQWTCSNWTSRVHKKLYKRSLAVLQIIVLERNESLQLCIKFYKIHKLTKLLTANSSSNCFIKKIYGCFMTKINMIKLNLFKLLVSRPCAPWNFRHIPITKLHSLIRNQQKRKENGFKHLTTNPYPFFKLTSRSFPKPRKNFSTSRSLVPYGNLPK